MAEDLDQVARPRWNVAPYFLVEDVVATRAICNQMYGCRDFEIRDCNGYTLCFGHNLEG